MKQNRSRLIKLLLILILVFAVFILKKELPNYLPKKSNSVFSDLKKEQINEINITKTKTTQIYKKNDDWFVKKNNTEFKADIDRVEKLITAVINLKKDNVISTNKNKHNDLGIDKQKIEIKYKQKNYLLYIGENANLNSNYVRINKENEVFLAEGFSELFIDEDFRDLKIPAVNIETNITSIQINDQTNSTLLTKKGDSWKSGGQAAKKDRVDFYLNDLKTLKAEDILKKKEFYPEVLPELSITIKENGKDKTISFYPQDEELYLATLTASDFDYLIPAAYVASLKKEAKDFIE